MTQNEWDNIRSATRAILIDIDQESNVLDEPPAPLLDTDDLAHYLNGVTFEISLTETLAFTFAALADAADAFAAAHRLAAKTLVSDPNKVQLEEVENDLRAINKAVVQDANFHGALALAGAVADIAAKL